jgi:spastin
VNSNSTKNVLVLAATNRPGDLDEAALRRLTRRIYMPLPDHHARLGFIKAKLKDGIKNSLTDEELEKVGELTAGYSIADLSTLIKEVAMMGIREIPTEELLKMTDMT